MPKGQPNSRVHQPCGYCGKPAYSPPNRRALGWQAYCNKACYHAAIGTSDDPVEAFWMKVDKRGPDECWPWKAQLRWDGYGRFIVKRKPQWSHRFSWELHNGKKIPAGMHVLHSCDNPACVNPKHLSIGTHQDNMKQMHDKRRSLETASL